MTADHSPNWRHVAAFLGLTFGLTWLLDLAVYSRGGLLAPGITPIIQPQGYFPAFSAILLGLFFFPESPIYHSRPAGPGRWFFYYFLLLTAVAVLGALAGWLYPSQAAIVSLATLVPQVLTYLGLLVLVVLRLVAGREAMARVWLGWGRWRDWLLFGLGFVAFYALQAALNAYFGLGGTQLTIPTPPGLSPAVVLILGAIQTVLLLPLLAIVGTFGEEYAWRGYLQTELFKLGRVRGALILGVIWGAWHWPLILMGDNYPGHPLLGVVLMTLNTTGVAVVLGYAVLRSRSVLLTAFLHGVNNQVANFVVAVGFKPHDNAFAFGIGIYGIATLAIIAVLILRDPIWRGKGSDLDPAQPTTAMPA